MLLDVDPADVPEQPASDRVEDYAQYVDVVRVYLLKHYGLTYAEIDPAVSPAPNGFHIIVGETVRDAERTYHAMIGVRGKPHWDVHPSRAGLTSTLRWGVLIPFSFAPPAWRADFGSRMGSQACSCRACYSSVSKTDSISSSSNTTDAGPSA